MKKINWMFGVLLSLLAAPLVASPIVYFDFDGDGLQDTTTTVAVGDTVTVDIYVTVDDVHGGLVSWGTEVGFDSSLITADAYTIQPGWPLAGVGNNIDNVAGSVELLASSFFGQIGTIKLAEITFDTLDTGVATLSIDELFSDLISFDGFVAADGYAYDAEIDFLGATAAINITAVPVPGALVLFMSGIAGLIRFRRKQY